MALSRRCCSPYPRLSVNVLACLRVRRQRPKRRHDKRRNRGHHALKRTLADMALVKSVAASGTEGADSPKWWMAKRRLMQSTSFSKRKRDEREKRDWHGRWERKKADRRSAHPTPALPSDTIAENKGEADE